MAERFPTNEVDPITPEKLERFRALRQRNAPPVPAPPQSAEVAPAQRREVPAAYLQTEPKPLSAYDDNPVLNEAGAAFIVGVTADCLKKWRQRKQGPDYIQYGTNGHRRLSAAASTFGLSLLCQPSAAFRLLNMSQGRISVLIAVTLVQLMLHQQLTPSQSAFWRVANLAI